MNPDRGFIQVPVQERITGVQGAYSTPQNTPNTKHV